MRKESSNEATLMDKVRRSSIFRALFGNRMYSMIPNALFPDLIAQKHSDQRNRKHSWKYKRGYGSNSLGDYTLSCMNEIIKIQL